MRNMQSEVIIDKPPAVSASVIRPLNGDVKSESKSVTLAPRYDDATMMMISDHCVGDLGNANNDILSL